jgi:hypothetical protein
VLKLQNPLKIVKLVDQVAGTQEELDAPNPHERRRQQRQEQQQQQQQQSGGQGGNERRQVSKVSPSDSGGAGTRSEVNGDVGAGPTRDGGGGGGGGRRRSAGRKDRRGGGDGGGAGEEREGRNQRRTSLRIGTGRKGRGAELSQRRGSLKKRDRTAEREARAEAAMERRTVRLPEGPVTVGELAELIDEKPVGVIKYLMTGLGVMASMTQSLDPATCVAVVEGFGKIVAGADEDEEL